MDEPIIPESELRMYARDSLKTLLYFASHNNQESLSSSRAVLAGGFLQALAEYCGWKIPENGPLHEHNGFDYNRFMDREKLQPRTVATVDYFFRPSEEESIQLHELLRPWGDMKFCSTHNGLLLFSPHFGFEIEEIILRNLAEPDKEELTALGQLMRKYVKKD